MGAQKGQKLALISSIVFVILLVTVTLVNQFDKSLQKYQTTRLSKGLTEFQFKQVIGIESVLYKANNTINSSLEYEKQNDNGVVYDRVKFGPYGWKVLHVFAANYPHKPTESDQEKIKLFLYLFADLFPCKKCGAHFRQELDSRNIPTESRDSIRQYLCEIHNKVNFRLNKTQFNCSTLIDVYGNPGGCGCSSAASSSEPRNLQQNQEQQEPKQQQQQENEKQKSTEIVEKQQQKYLLKQKEQLQMLDDSENNQIKENIYNNLDLNSI